ncbi:DNA polymerase lambda [Caerostris darwini]|uniref:DNA polymerase n=1 Tax=Caerostris darwini TaxID=1538125 RepID=A0AAV4VQH8_9ARAC|nr:DNA polymerase lambda [Caerostris darwini]
MNLKGDSWRLVMHPNNPNAKIIKILKILYESFIKSKEQWRIDVYEKAIILLGKFPKAIDSQKELYNLIPMSQRIAKKVWQIIQTGYLEEIDILCGRGSEQTRKLFSKAWGIGPRFARELYKEGYYTLLDLQKSSKLSQAQQIGLLYFKDLKTKMSKEEANMILKAVIEEVFKIDSSVQCDGCSTLRRKKKTCGHVSLLITLPAGSDNDHQFLPAIITRLHQIGYLVDDLIRHEENGAQTKYVGIIKLKGMTKFRRIDITVCSQEEYACAMLYLTGSSYFNKAIRQWAGRREMVLDEHSLRIRILNIQGGTQSVRKLKVLDEINIFNYLNLPYRAPEHRDCFI